MSDTVKLIIEIPRNEYKYTCERTLSDRTMWDDAIRNGTPLDSVKAEKKGETEEVTNEEMLDKVLRNFFPRALFIREINEASHTKKIIFSDEWLNNPYKGGE